MSAATTAMRSASAMAWRLASMVAAAFTVAVGASMIVAHLEHKSSDPWKSPHLLQLKEQLRAEPRNESLKTEIRELDLQLRQRYFRLLAFKASGVYLLVGGAAVFLMTSAQVRQIRRRPHYPKLDPLGAELHSRSRAQSRLALAGCGLAVAGAFVGAALGSKSPLPSGGEEAAKLFVENGSEATVPPVPDCAGDEELRANWPGFRGFDGSGVSTGTNFPVRLDGASALWTVPVPSQGFNSPIVFGGRVFITGGDVTSRDVFCYDLNTGELRWRQSVTNVPGSPAQPADVSDLTGYCAPTAATDGRRVYAWFATGDIAAFTLDGTPVWARHLGVPKNMYGHATSLRTWRDRVIVQFDQGEAEDRLSKLLALDGRTGRTVWETPRPVGATWTTPIVIDAAGKAQIVTLSLPYVISYDAVKGGELWRADLLEGEVTPSAVFAGGSVFIVSPSVRLMSIRPEGSGDVTSNQVAWSAEDLLPDISSPVSDGGAVFTVASGGLALCFDARDGKKLWEHDFGVEVQASPAIAAGQLIVLGTQGDVIVAAAARSFDELYRGKLDDEFHASPAFAEGKTVLRGKKQLWCFGGKP
jgi:outer membrane protein assembly factor BamB